jgi:capsular exopolysaccharide synthesis family protein
VGLRDYLSIARRHWWIFLVSLGFALAVAVVINIRTPPVYASAVTFFFTNPSTLSADLYPASMFSQGRLNSYAAVLTSDRITVPLAGTPGLRLTSQEIAERIIVEAVPNTVMLRVTVEDRSPARAQLLATALVPRFQAVISALEQTNEKGQPVVRVEVVAGPRLEDDPVAPRPLNNLAMAAMVGLIVGAALVVAREVTDSAVRSVETLQTLVSAPVLARVPVDARAPTGAGPFVSDNDSPRAEALRQLRANLQYADGDRAVQVIAVTSAVEKEGRSATACSLGLLFAEAGRRVLVVDAELRRPRLAAFLGRENAAGLSTVLSGGASVDQALQPWGAGLWLLSAGHSPPNPSELLSSPRMAEVIEELRGRFDIIIVDCPPLLAVTDAAIVAARSDGALLVVRSRKTKNAQVTTAVRALHAVDARVLGCVLNMVPAKSGDVFPQFERYAGGGAAASGEVPGNAPAATGRARFWHWSWAPCPPRPRAVM